MSLATGQISIVDYDDALTLTGFITANHPKTQQYNPDNDTYIPDWTKEPLELDASLFKIGSSKDIIDSSEVVSVEWYDDTGSGETEITTGNGYEVNGSILKIKQNVLKKQSTLDISCEVTYHDDSTGLNLIHKMGISLSKVKNGSGVSQAVAWLPGGNIFKNDSVDSLDAEAKLFRGGTEDTEDVTFQWYKRDPDVTTDEGGGKGWKELSSTSNNGETGYDKSVLTVPSEAVPYFQTYKVIITDTAKYSSTEGESFSDTVSFTDQSDPVQVSITSKNGNIFKNGVGSTVLEATLFRSGEEIDTSGNKYTYKWYKYDQDGNLDTSFGSSNSDYQSGKSVNVDSDDVKSKATFIVEVEK